MIHRTTALADLIAPETAMRAEGATRQPQSVDERRN